MGEDKITKKNFFGLFWVRGEFEQCVKKQLITKEKTSAKQKEKQFVSPTL
ncbi:MAG: hypothetical protein V1660_02565 [archaeon]